MDTNGVHVTLTGIVAVGSLLGLLIVVAGILGAAFRTSRNVQSITNYRDAAQSWEARAVAQEREMADQASNLTTQAAQIEGLQHQLADKDRQLDGLQEQIVSLRELLSGRAAFESLAEKFAEALALAAENRKDLRTLLEIEQRREATP
jgi:uncharacterized protein HemX